MREICLTMGKVAIVDDEDYGELSRFKWHAVRDGRVFYAVRNSPRRGGERGRLIYMHRQLLEAEPGQRVDHIDRDGLNNSQSNLRFASHSMNCANQRLSYALQVRKTRSNCSSQVHTS